MKKILMGLLALLAIVTACDPGSKTFTYPFYNLTWNVAQDKAGAVRLAGQTDIGQGAEIDVILTKTSDVSKAIDEAVLSGSSGSPFSTAVDRHGKFSIVLSQALTNSCNNQAPCGPFPAGTYWLMVDGRTPVSAGGLADPMTTTYGDPRYVAQTHGFVGFAGIEIMQQVTLNAISLRVDSAGNQVNSDTGQGGFVAVPAASPVSGSKP